MPQTFKIKSSAVRAAKQAGIDPKVTKVQQDANGLWFFTIEAMPDPSTWAIEENDPVPAPVVLADEEEDPRPAFLKIKTPEPDALTVILQKGEARQKRIAEKPVAPIKPPKPAKGKGKEKTPARIRREDGLVVGSLSARLVDAVLRVEGASFKELTEIAGWSDCRPLMKTSCKKAGVETSCVSGRYYGTRIAKAA